MGRSFVVAKETKSETLKPVNRREWIKRPPTTEIGRRLIGAAVEEFADKGLLGARVAEITRKAGTTDAVFYRYFPGMKQAALYILSEFYWALLNTRLRHYREATDDPERLFELTVEALIQAAKDDPASGWLDEEKVFRILVAEMRNPALLPESLLDDEYIQFHDALEEIIRSGHQSGVFSGALDPNVAAHLVVAVLHGPPAQNRIPYPPFQVSNDELRRAARILVGSVETFD